MYAPRAVLTVAFLVVALFAASGVVPANPQTRTAADTEPRSVTIEGVDLHDGMITKVGMTYHLYGTRYGCGFEFLTVGSPWCGFGVSTSPSLDGPWSEVRELFDPARWQRRCGSTGQGCFNPRMFQRAGWGPDDGQWLLWFNAPRDFDGGRNAYWSMICDSPVGPCHDQVKPDLGVCTDNGDFSIVADAPRNPVILCTMRDQTLASERLDRTGRSGTGTGHRNLARAERAEGPGAYRDPHTGTWILTFNEHNCGYCAGAPTSYATAAAIGDRFSSPDTTNRRFGATALGRRGISATSCGGQSRTVVTLDGNAYQFIDLWVGSMNEEAASVHLEPLVYHGDAEFGSPLQAFDPWSCGRG